MAGPEAISATALSKEVGVAQATLSRWLLDASNLKSMSKNNRSKDAGDPRPQRWSFEEKLRVVHEAASLSNEELGAYLRRNGLHEAQLQEWRAAFSSAVQNVKRKKSDRTPEARRIQELERELLRKDRALAEVAALLALKKKVQEIWGDEGDDTRPRSET